MNLFGSEFLREDGEAPFDERFPFPFLPPRDPGEESPPPERDPANESAQEALLEGTADPLQRERARWFLEFARAELRPTAPLDRERAAECAGHYDSLDVLLFGDGLALATDDLDLEPLLPFDVRSVCDRSDFDDVYYFPNVPEIRARFLRDAAGRVVALRVFSFEGEPRDHRRTDL